MVTGIKDWLQKSIRVIIALFVSVSAFSQPMYLEPELTANNGLNSNAVRVIKQDRDNRIWIGSDLGIHILNDADNSFETISKKVGPQPVWAITFYKEFVLIGTRFDGVYIFNLPHKALTQHFDSSKIGLSRRFRVLKDTVFLATKNAPVFFTLQNNLWQLHKLHTDVKEGFVTDFTLWQNRVYASAISYFDAMEKNLLRRLEGDSLIPVEGITFVDKADLMKMRGGLGLCLETDSINLYEGGDGYINTVDLQKSIKVNILQDTVSGKYYPVWDVLRIKDKIFLTVGNPDNVQEGMIVVSPLFNLKGLRPNFYGLCLYYDNAQHTLWTGTQNRGLFIWRFVENISAVQKFNPSDEFELKPVSKDTVLLYNKDIVILKDLSTGIETIVHQRIENKIRDTEIADVIYAEGKIFIRLYYYIKIFQLKNSGIELLKTLKYTNSANRLLFTNGQLYLFSMYVDQIARIDFQSGKETFFNAPSNQVRIRGINSRKSLYHSTYSGFYVFDTISHSLNVNIPEVESFTLTGDTLWVLNAGSVSAYKINYETYQSKLLFENGLKDKLNSWMPLWVTSLKGAIFCGNDQGFLKLDQQTGNPVSYLYMGNYSKGLAPVGKDQYLFFNHGNYITRLHKETIDNLSKAYSLGCEISPSSVVYEQTPISVRLKSNEYIGLRHSLKRLEFWKSGRLFFVRYTLGDHLEFPSGMKKGWYTLKVFSNNQLIQEIRLRVRIPLTSNPVFYIVVSLFVVFFFFMIFKYLLSKRNYERNMLENRLQLLKQNLNPHFIFNSLNLIYSLVLQKKNDAAIRTINNFSDLHRYYLDNINKQKIALKDELLFIESYLKMESERVEIDDPFIYDLPESIGTIIAEKEVPPMILQPLIENAVKYASNDGDIRKIWIDFQSNDEKITVGIENTISNEKTKSSGKGLGLKLVQERIDIYNKTYKEKIEFRSDVPCHYTVAGYRCELSFPV